MYFKYGKTETEYLKNKCVKLGAVIDKLGIIKRQTDKDLFSSVVNCIVGQQISSKALHTIWTRFENALKVINPDTVINAGEEKLQSFGISYKKAQYILDFANKIKNKEFDLESIWQKTDEEVISELVKLKGIGVWTAEMLMLFCMERKNILSYNDSAIQKGLRMVYHHRKITKPLFEKYRKKFSPYCSIASLYLWAAANGQIEGMKDYAPKKLLQNVKKTH